jgi:hypothetical protein
MVHMEQLRDHRSFYFVQEQILSFIIVVYVKDNYPRPQSDFIGRRDAIITAQSGRFGLSSLPIICYIALVF